VYIVSGKSDTDNEVERPPCDRTHLGLFLVVAYLCSPNTLMRASACPCQNKQCSATFEHTLVAFECTAEPATFACMRSNVLPALERTSASCINIPKAVCYVFVSSSFD
jgi:hypothetical protein